MTEYYDKWEKEIAEEVAKEAIESNSLEIAKKMLSSGKLSLDDIAEYTDLSIEKVTELARDKAV